MRNLLRTLIAVTVGVAVLLAGQLVIEIIAWWWTGGTTTFDDPLFNGLKFAAAATVGFAAVLAIGLEPRRRRSLV